MATDLVSVQREIERVLREHVLACWFPRCIDDRHGGYHQDYARDWSRVDTDARDLVFQARMLWVCATVARLRPDLQDEFTGYAEHGMRGMQMFQDSQYGGLLLRPDDDTHKHSYAIAFGLFAYCSYYRLRGDPRTLSLMRVLFDWWKEHGWDARHGGFYDVLSRQGAPVLHGFGFEPLIPVAAGLRSSNTLIHVIEALTEYYVAAPQAVVGATLKTVVDGFEKSLLRQRSRLFTSYTRAWDPVDRRVSFGHDIETITLMSDARRALGLGREAWSNRMANRVVAEGIDRKHRGMYHQTNKWFGRDKRKMGWVQAEALLGLIELHLGSGRDHSPYLDAFLNVWAFIRGRLVDEVHNGIFGVASRDGDILDHRKGHRWKACYHYVRALLRVSDLLRDHMTPNA